MIILSIISIPGVPADKKSLVSRSASRFRPFKTASSIRAAGEASVSPPALPLWSAEAPPGRLFSPVDPPPLRPSAFAARSSSANRSMYALQFSSDPESARKDATASIIAF